MKPDRELGPPGREGQEGDTVQGEQLGEVITGKRIRCRELIVVEGFSDVQRVLACKLHLPFLVPSIATHSNFILLFSTYTKHRDQDKDGRLNAIGTCLHNNILVLDRDCGALHSLVSAVWLSGLPLEVHQNPEESS